MVQKPGDHLIVSAADGEALMAQVHQSSMPQADAKKVEWVIRMYFAVVFALQEAKLSVKRLRTLLCGKPPMPSSAPDGSAAASQGAAEGLNASSRLAADAETGALGQHAPPVAVPRPERATPKGGHRPGTGRLGADAYVGARRLAGRHEERAVGQRCPVCGQGTL